MRRGFIMRAATLRASPPVTGFCSHLRPAGYGFLLTPAPPFSGLCDSAPPYYLPRRTTRIRPRLHKRIQTKKRGARLRFYGSFFVLHVCSAFMQCMYALCPAFSRQPRGRQCLCRVRQETHRHLSLPILSPQRPRRRPLQSGCRSRASQVLQAL